MFSTGTVTLILQWYLIELYLVILINWSLLYIVHIQDKVKISPRQGMVNIMIIAQEHKCTLLYFYHDLKILIINPP